MDRHGRKLTFDRPDSATRGETVTYTLRRIRRTPDPAAPAASDPPTVRRPRLSAPARSRISRWAGESFRVTVAVAVVLVVLTALQSRFLYFPSREMVASPADAGMAYEDVRMTAEDGVTIHGWWMPAPDAPATVLFLHGNAGNVSYWLDAVRGYRALGWNVLLIDYRGYGLSDGAPSEHGTYLDAKAAWRHLIETRGIDRSRIVVVGRSLGGGVALGLLQDFRPAGVILEATFTSIPDMVAHVMRFSLLGALMRIHYPNLERVRGIDVPVLVVHSPHDDLVPFAHGRALFEAAPEPKRFLEIRGGHNEGFYEASAEYLRGVREFVEQIIPPAKTGSGTVSGG